MNEPGQEPAVGVVVFAGVHPGQEGLVVVRAAFALIGPLAIRIGVRDRIADVQDSARRRLERVGGVPKVSLMEEFELCGRLKKEGRLALADTIVSTSGRRFRERGVLRTYARMWRVMLQYRLGTSTEKLQELYERR